METLEIGAHLKQHRLVDPPLFEVVAGILFWASLWIMINRAIFVKGAVGVPAGIPKWASLGAATIIAGAIAAIVHTI